MATEKLFKTKAVDVNDKGLVVIAVNAFNNVDADGDISMPGSFTKTLQENFSRVKWFLNHDRTQLLGVPIKGQETAQYLEMTAQFNMEKQMSRDIYTDYKLYASTGKTLEHSIGVDPIKRDTADNRKVLEWKLWEFSTLTSWGANENTPLLAIKSQKDVLERLDLLEKAAKMQYSDERFKVIEIEVKSLKKALSGEMMVTCPCCGHVFDYNEQGEMTMDQQILDYARDYARWMMQDCVSEEMSKLEPDIQARVEAVIAAQNQLQTKSLDDLVNYVRCPKCWSRVGRTNKTISEPVQATQTKEIDESSRESTLTLKSIGKLLG